MDERTIVELSNALERVGKEIESAADAQLEIIREVARREARKEIASLCGLIMGRLGENSYGVRGEKLESIFGEAVSDFSGHTKGEAPGE